jgi:hypothetical protein
MTFFAEERAVSPVLGGILMFGLAASLLILTQVSLVPAANQQVEFEHNLGVQADFERFQGSATRVAATGAPESVDVDLGVRYPNRFFLVNPPSATGRLTTEDATIAIANVNATNPETAEYFASRATAHTLAYDTKRLVYEPNYRQYGTAPRTVYEHGAVYNRYDGDVTLSKSTVPIVSGNEITFVLLDGDLNEQSVDSTTIRLQAASAPAQRISVTDTGAPITITLETFLPQSDWDAFVAGESTVTLQSYGDSGNGETPNQVVLALDDGGQYTLRVATVTIGDDSPTTESGYVTTVGSYARSVPANTSMSYTVEVRDAQHNPSTDDTVTATIDGPATFSNGANLVTAAVDEDGRATVTVTGNANALGTVTVDVGLDTDSDDDLRDENAHDYVTYRLAFVSTDVTNVEQVADVGSAINPGLDSGALVFETSALSSNEVTMTFRYTGTEPTEITAARVNYYFVASPGVNGNPDSLVLDTEGGATRTIEIGGVWQDLSTDTYSLTPGEQLVVTGQLFDGNSPYTLKGTSDDFFMLSLEFDDGSTKVYIVPISK